MAKSFAHFDDMCWPLAGERVNDIEWLLRHEPARLTRQDQLVAASIISAYRQMIADPATKRAKVIRELRAASSATGDGDAT